MRLQRSHIALLTMSLVAGGGAVTAGSQAAAAADASNTLVAASAGTLVYIKDHDVWISRPDGSGQRRVTADGSSSWPYFSPSMADDGTIAVGHEGQIVRMRQGGTVLSRFTPRPLPTSSGGSAVALGQVAISPNGAKVAYSAVDVGCTSCSTATGYTAANRATDPQVDRTTFFKMPSWAGNGRTLQSGGFLFEVMIHDLRGQPVHWFDSEDGLSDVELSPDGRRLAGAAGYQGDRGIAYYDVVGNATGGPVPPEPTSRCTWSDEDGGALISPTWGPDSKALAFQANNGLWVADDVTTGCDGVDFTFVVAGATAPDWSAAAYNPGTASPTPPTRTFSITGRSKTTGKPRVGRKISVTIAKVSPRPSKVSYQWKSNGKVIKKATKRTYTVKRGDRRKKLSVVVTLRRAGYTTKTLAISAGRVR